MNRSKLGRGRVVAAMAVAVCALLFAGAAMFVRGSAPAVVSQEAHVPNSKILVVYYSRTGTTARVASSIARATRADVERLQDRVKRDGAFGFIRSLADAIRRSGTVLQPLTVDPAAYDLVIVGTPDWGKSISAPARTFLTTWRGRLPQVAFFLTDGTSDHAMIFKEMATLVGKEPLATVGIPHDDVDHDHYESQVADFIKALKLPGTAAQFPAAMAGEVLGAVTARPEAAVRP